MKAGHGNLSATRLPATPEEANGLIYGLHMPAKRNIIADPTGQRSSQRAADHPKD